MNVHNIILRTPNQNLHRLQCFGNQTTGNDIRNRLELIVGIPAELITLATTINKLEIKGDQALRFGTDLKDGEIVNIRFIDECWSNLLSSDENFDNITDEQAGCLLFMSAFQGNSNLCNKLIETGADLNFKTRLLENTPLHAAAAQDKSHILDLIMERGANSDLKNKLDKTAEDVSQMFGAATCVRRFNRWRLKRIKESCKKSMGNQQTTPTKPSNLSLTPNRKKLSPSNQPLNNSPNSVLQTTPTYDYNPDKYRALLDTAGGRTRIDLLAMGNEAADSENQKSPLERPATVLKITTSEESDSKKPSSKKSNSKRLTNITAVQPLEQSEIKRRRERRLNRSKSAPPTKTEITDERTEVMKRNYLRMSRPQYLQFIKSSTGIIEEDFFADIFPPQDPPKPVRSFHSQMERNSRIFKKMMKQLPKEDNSSDESEKEAEILRKRANDRAYERWKDKKEVENQNKLIVKSLQPSRPRNHQEKLQCVGPLLMIGDTTRGQIAPQDESSYIRAHKFKRTKSAGTLKKGDVTSYEEWMEIRGDQHQNNQSEPGEQKKPEPKLQRKIDYESWLVEANKRLEITTLKKKEEERQRKNFNKWIKDVKNDAGIVDYWMRQKEEQERLKRREEKKKLHQQKEREGQKQMRRKMSRDVYNDWVTKHELERLKREEEELKQERKRLRELKNRPNHH